MEKCPSPPRFPPCPSVCVPARERETELWCHQVEHIERHLTGVLRHPCGVEARVVPAGQLFATPWAPALAASSSVNPAPTAIAFLIPYPLR